jgi:hypothetical protein
MGRPATLSDSEFRALLDEVLTEANSDQRAGPVMRATGLRMRFEFPDIALTLNVCASDDPGRHLDWAFGEHAPREPRLELRMDSDVANGYLQGKESLAIAIARGKVKVKGSSHVALLYLPAVRLLVEPYRKVITTEHPQLALD